MARALTLVLLLLTGCATTGGLNIQPQPLEEALTEWAQLTGYQVIVPDIPARKSRRVRGANSMTALDQMLKGTGLTYRWVNARTVAIGELSVHPIKHRRVQR